MSDAEYFLDAISQHHRMPSLPVRQSVIDAINPAAPGYHPPGQLRVRCQPDPSSGTFRILAVHEYVPGCGWATTQSGAIGEIGWGYHDELGAIALWRTAWAYPTYGNAADNGQIWRLASSEREAYALLMVSALRQDYPALAVETYVKAMNGVPAYRTPLHDMQITIGHRNVMLAASPDRRRYYDPDSQQVLECQKAYIATRWRTRGFVLRTTKDIGRRGISGVATEPMQSAWTLADPPHNGYIVAYSQYHMQYDIRFGPGLPHYAAEAVKHTRGQIKFIPWMWHTMMTVSDGNANMGAMWEIVDNIEDYTYAPAPCWLESKDNSALTNAYHGYTE